VRLEGDRDKSDLVAVPTLYDRLHRAGYRTAEINWPCTRGAATLDDNFPDAPDPISQTTPRLRAELIRAGILDDAEDASFLKKSAAAADEAWSAAALHILQARPPNLLLLHLLVTDVIQHRYGPQSSAAYTALALADARAADLVRALDTAGMKLGLVDIIDVAPTIATLLGQDLPGADGKVLGEILSDANEH
jgi:Type I phosphodiesterase / nucleotide pyrophosphatase